MNHPTRPPRGGVVDPRAAQTPVYGWHLPVLADAANIPFDTTELATDIETVVARDSIRKFANAAARDTAIPTPVAGMMCHLADINAHQWYNGTRWTSQDPYSLGLVPSSKGVSMLAKVVLSDPSGNADFQFAPYAFTSAPLVTATAQHLGGSVTCTLKDITTTRAYAQVVDRGTGNAVQGIGVHYLVIGWLTVPPVGAGDLLPDGEES